MRHIKKNDQVQVIAGRDKGKQGKVLRMLPDREKALVSGINKVKRHLKAGARKRAEHGGIIEMEAPIHVSNLLPWCNACSKGVRVTMRYVGQGGKYFADLREALESFGGNAPEDIRKIRVCTKCDQAID